MLDGAIAYPTYRTTLNFTLILIIQNSMALGEALCIIKNVKKGGGWVSINLFCTHQTNIDGVIC